jgi:hypothetical protein
MKKQLVILGIIALLVCVGLCGCNTKSDFLTFDLSPNLDSYCIGIEYWLYNNVSNWQFVDPIFHQTTLISGSGGQSIPHSDIYLIRIRYVTFIDNDYTGRGCSKYTFPEEINNKVFMGTFTTSETFTIQSTGYITKSDGTLLSETL